MDKTHYRLSFPGLLAPVRLAVLADIHAAPPPALLSAVAAARPDLLLLPGDFLQRGRAPEAGFSYLAALSQIAPTFCSAGNHESDLPADALAARVAEAGARLLDSETVSTHGLLLGGVASGYRHGLRQRRTRSTPAPDLAFLSDFAARPGPRLLLCHHPEYYEPYLRALSIPLILSGHAHGGQWRLFGRGIFSPGQGIFPRYTAGLYEGRLLVSRGLSNPHPLLPRFGNPPEMVLLSLIPAS